MRDKERHNYEMLVRVRDLGVEHGGEFPSGSLLHTQFGAVNSIVTELQSHIGEQSAGRRVARQSASSKAAAREKLRADLAAINRTAKTLALDTPGLDEQFEMPPRNDAALAGAARACLSNAAPLKTRFLQNEMPADFLDVLQADLTAFETTINSKNLSKEQHVAATASIQDLLARGSKTVKQLDTLVRNRFASDPAMLAAWTSASHVERDPQPSKATKTTKKAENQPPPAH